MSYNDFNIKWGVTKTRKTPKQNKNKRTPGKTEPFCNDDVAWLGSFAGASQMEVEASYPNNYSDDDDYDDNDNDDDDDDDDDVLFGSIHDKIVGIRHHEGEVNNGERVILQREPNNKHDGNAIQVLNMEGEVVGYITKELAIPLADILDNKLAWVERVVPSGQDNLYSIPIEIMLYGDVEKKYEAASKLKSHRFTLRDTSATASSSQTSGSHLGLDYSHVVSKRVLLSPNQDGKEMDKLFNTLEEGDKTTMAEPTPAIRTPLYPHQKQALNWMMCKENNEALPPFWEKRGQRYYNSLTKCTTSVRPPTVRGGILADDMGLGKTLEVICLILTNFHDGQPLAVPVAGRRRFGESSKSKTKAKGNKENYKEDSDDDDDGPRKKFQRVTDSENDDDDGEDENADVEDDDDDDDVEDDDDDVKDDGKEGDDVEDYDDDGEEGEYVEEDDDDDDDDKAEPRKKSQRVIYDDDDEAGQRKKFQRVTDSKDNDDDGEDDDDDVKDDDDDVKDDGKEGDDVEDDDDDVEDDDDDEEEGEDDNNDKAKPRKKSRRITEDGNDVNSKGGKPRNKSKTAFSMIGNCNSSAGRTKSDKPRTTLIVCPLSVMNDWLSQLKRHIRKDVELMIYEFHGKNRTTNSEFIENQDIVISTYNTIAADFKGKDILTTVHWLRIILDEGHCIRNSNTLTAKAMMELKAERKWVVTGTPIQNSIKDLYSLVNFLNISPLTDLSLWKHTIERPIAQGHESDKKKYRRVRALNANILMRRTKNQKFNGKPLVKLPARNVYLEKIQFTDEERQVYAAMQEEGEFVISSFFQKGTLLENNTKVLVIVIRLRQLCCHPLLCSKAALGVQQAMDGDATKKELIDAVLNSGSDEECPICSKSFKKPVITPCAHVYCRACIEDFITKTNNNTMMAPCPMCQTNIKSDKLIEIPEEKLQEPETPIVTDENWQSSSKVDALMKALVEQRIDDPTVKSVIVSQFTSLLTLIEVPLKLNGFKFARLDGTMTNKKRVDNIEKFMDPSPDSPTIFLLSLKAGGVGINLTAARRVFLMEPAWNPSVEEQCFDRCHRLGQKYDVNITKFVIENSVEERMLALQERKRALMNGAFSKKQTADERRTDRINESKTLFGL